MRSLLLVAAVLLQLAAAAQQYKIRIGDALQEYRVDQLSSAIRFNTEIKTISVKKDPADANPKTYKVQVGNEEPTFSTDGAFHPVTFTADIRGKSILILTEAGAPAQTFTLAAPENTGSANPPDDGGGTPPGRVILPDYSATQYITNTLFPSQLVDVAHVGLRIRAGADSTRFSGPKYIHLFFDQNGNTLISAIPVGISGAIYVVHIVYLVPKSDPQVVDYKVNPNQATVEEGTVIRSDGGLNNGLQLQAGGLEDIEFEWRHFEINLRGSSTDRTFDIVRNSYALKAGVFEIAASKVVATRTIKMQRIFHGSIDVGILETRLSNPTYALVNSDMDPTQKVVKRSNEGRRMFASAMYTFYVSPIILLEKIFAPQRVSNYKLEGRNFVDDHRIYERIYPTVGIGLNDRLLDNIFIGGKWEFARGGSLFLGYHKGKVNSLDVDPSFEYAKTSMTQEGFDLKNNTKWTGAFCLGLNLDVRIVTNLFQRGAAGASTP